MAFGPKSLGLFIASSPVVTDALTGKANRCHPVASSEWLLGVLGCEGFWGLIWAQQEAVLLLMSSVCCGHGKREWWQACRGSVVPVPGLCSRETA